MAFARHSLLPLLAIGYARSMHVPLWELQQNDMDPDLASAAGFSWGLARGGT